MNVYARSKRCIKLKKHDVTNARQRKKTTDDMIN